jgi:excisionase family DNA binding protein
MTAAMLKVFAEAFSRNPDMWAAFIAEQNGEARTSKQTFEVLTAEEAAELLRVSVAALLSDASSGRLPGRRIGEEWRFARMALLDWLSDFEEAEQTVVPRPPAGVGAAYADEDPEEVIAAIQGARKQNPVGG